MVLIVIRFVVSCISYLDFFFHRFGIRFGLDVSIFAAYSIVFLL